MSGNYLNGWGNFPETPNTGYTGMWGRLPEAVRDNTAVNRNYKSPRTLYWENPRAEYPVKPLQEELFVSELQKDAIRKEAEQMPQSGHVEPQFFPAMGVMKGVRQTSGLMKDDVRRKITQMLKK